MQLYNVQFYGYNTNASPSLTLGKHKFEIDVLEDPTEYTAQGYKIPSDLPKMKTGGRVVFEFKDSAGTVVFSDTTPYYKTRGFILYICIKTQP